MKNLKGKIIYKASTDGELTIDQQIEVINELNADGGFSTPDFEKSLKYDITRTVFNILSNASIKERSAITPLCESLMKNLNEIFFKLHDYGEVFVKLDGDRRIIDVNNTFGNIKLVDPAYSITKITQKSAVEKALALYGVVNDAIYSVIDERGVLGVFSPQANAQLKTSRMEKFYDSMRIVFGVKKGQRKFAVTETPMNYTGVTIPVKDMELREYERMCVARVARLYGIQEDMILSGSTFDNKSNAIIQTYSDYKGVIYGWINQIIEQTLTLSSVDDFEVTFSGVPQLTQQPLTNGN